VSYLPHHTLINKLYQKNALLHAIPQILGQTGCTCI